MTPADRALFAWAALASFLALVVMDHGGWAVYPAVLALLTSRRA